jgi:hypothetical protein
MASGGSLRGVACWVVSRHEPKTSRTGWSVRSPFRVRITLGGYEVSGSGHTRASSRNTSYGVAVSGVSPSTTTIA